MTGSSRHGPELPEATRGGVPARWQAAPAQSVWFAQDGYLAHLNRSEGAHLMFDRPLAGAFEFSVDAWHGNSGGGSIGYGGVVLAPNEGQGQAGLSSVGGGDAISRTAEGIRQDFNRLSVQASAGTVRYLVNGRLVYEDTDSPPTAPWLMLARGGDDKAVFRNFTLAGKPEVLSEVKLTAGNSLGGWTPSVYGGRLPQRLALKERERGEFASTMRDRGTTPTRTPEKSRFTTGKRRTANCQAASWRSRPPGRCPTASPISGRYGPAKPCATSSSMSRARRTSIPAWDGWRSSWSRKASDFTG